MRKIIPITIAILVTIIITVSVFSMPTTGNDAAITELSQSELKEVVEKYVQIHVLALYLPEEVSSGKCKVVAQNIMNLIIKTAQTQQSKYA